MIFLFVVLYYASDEQKEIAPSPRELHDAQDALDVLKAFNLGKMTEAIYLKVSEKTEAAKRLDAGFPSPEC